MVRRYFGTFIGMMRSQYVISFACVGINPESTDWHLLHSEWADFASEGFDMDFRNFDGKAVFAEFVTPIARMITDWYDDGFYEAREKMLYDVINAVSRCGDFIIERHQGNSSGWPMTTELNCIVCYFLYAYAFVCISQNESRGLSISDFDEMVRPKTYGDDVGAAVKSSAREWYTVEKIQEVFKALGIEVTSPQKEGVISYKPIDELTFLKRGFRYEERLGSVVPVISEQVLKDMTQYIHRQQGYTDMEMLMPNLQEVLYFASYHGEEKYNYYLSVLNEALSSIGEQPIVHPYLMQYQRQQEAFGQGCAGVEDFSPIWLMTAMHAIE